MYRIIFTAKLVVISVICFGQIKNDTLLLKFPDSAKISDKFQAAIAFKTQQFYTLFSTDRTKIKSYSPEFILDKIDNDSNYHYQFIAEYWIAFHYKEIIPELIKRLTDKKEVGLVNSLDLIIQERIESGQLKEYGHGGISFDDLFTVAGRANRLLCEITGEEPGHVSMYSTKESLSWLQNEWIKWLERL